MVNWYAIESFADSASNRTMRIPKMRHQIKMTGFVHFVKYNLNNIKATCFCSRCQRNDIMIKLRDLYTLCGGDIDELSKDSVFEKYVKT